ncbi:MAG: hypothetical protein ABW061_22060 [Polyangiaceae bacterium]
MAQSRDLGYFDCSPTNMRLAIVAASSYEENGQVAPIPNAELDVELFGGRLADVDAGFVVHAMPAQRGLAEGIDELIARLGERPKELIVYFWGYALNSEERGPTLLLDGPKLAPLTLTRLRRQLSEAADVSLVVLDATLAEGSFGAPLDVVRTMGAALSGGDSSVSSLIAVRQATQRMPEGPPPFTGLVQMILDAHTGSVHALTPDALFRAMQAEEVMFADIPAAGCFLGSRSFVVVPGARPLTVPPPRPPPVSYHEEMDEVTAPRFAVPEPQEPARLRSRRPPPPPPPILRQPVREALPSESELVIEAEPSSSAAAHCRRLFRDFERAGDRDGAYRAALCLEALGEADINESLLATMHRPVGLQAVRNALSFADWHDRLSAGVAEVRATVLLRALGPALARVGFQHARRLRRDLSLPEDARQEPEKSTTTLAKTLYWTSRFLSVNAASLFVLPEVGGSLALTPGPERPIVVCERALGSGFSIPELVCLWARELSFARPEQAALCYFPDVTELSQLLVAALAVGGATSMRAIDGDAKRLASGLKREVRGAALDALRAAAQSFPVHEVHARAESFIRSAEFVADRVALVACGDLELTLKLDRRFPRARLTKPEERRADLFQFTLGHELGQIRAALGVAVS